MHGARYKLRTQLVKTFQVNRCVMCRASRTRRLQNPALIPQAAELEVKAVQLREEDYRRELSSQGECLEQRAAELNRLGKVRRHGHLMNNLRA